MSPARLLGGPRDENLGILGHARHLQPSDLGDNTIMLKRGSRGKWGIARENESEGLMAVLIMTIITA